MKMELHQASIEQIKEDLLFVMREFMEETIAEGDESSYSEEHILSCEKILDEYISNVRSAPHGDTSAVMALVRSTVLALNSLNEKCDHSLIETDQREQICLLMVQAAADSGVGSGEDITEEWREW